MKKLIPAELSFLRRYFTEKNALTVMTSMFCFTMMIIGIIRREIWISLAFALAFSFSIEVICHRTRENRPD